MPSSPINTLLATPSDTDFTPPPAGSPLVPMYEDGSGPFYFGMTLKQFYQRAEQLGWTWNPASGLDENSWVVAGGAGFRFTPELVLDALEVMDGSLQTERGFRVGDSRKKLFQLYGTDYENQGGGGVDVFEFRLPNGLYFTAFVDRGKDKISNWSYWREE